MAKFIIDQNSLNDAVRDISSEWADIVSADRNDYEKMGTKQMQNAIRYLRVYYKGPLDQNSYMKQTRSSSQIEWSFETDNSVEYAIYPRNGLGTSAQYGPRKYDVRAAVKMLKRYGLLAPNLQVGTPRPRQPRDKNIPPQNLI